MVEQDASEARRITEQISIRGRGEIDVASSTEASSYQVRLNEEHFDAIVLSLGQEACADEYELDAILESAPNIAIVILSGLEDSELALRLVRRGAQDYLLRSMVDGEQLVRALRHAVERKRIERQLRFLADYDPLTGLANRKHFGEELRRACSRVDRSGKGIALMLVDLDDFKPVNDNFGHDVGDAVLVRVAGRMKSNVREGDLVARLGGDEFALLLYDVQETAHAEQVALKLLGTLETPIPVGDSGHRVGASIGIALYPSDLVATSEGDGRIDELLKFADIAMYEAKQSGGNDIRHYRDVQRESYTTRVDDDLTQLLERHLLSISLTPRLKLRDNTISMYELSVGCNRLGIPASEPHRLHNLARALGLSMQLGRSMLFAAATALKLIDRGGNSGDCGKIALSLPWRYLQSDQCIEDLGAMLAGQEHLARRLALQLPSVWAFETTQKNSKQLERFAQCGVELWLDRFGESPMTLSSLDQLPLKGVTLSSEQICLHASDSSRSQLAAAIIQFAHALKLEVCAKNVHASAQLVRTRALACDLAQGLAVHMEAKVSAKEFELADERASSPQLNARVVALNATTESGSGNSLEVG